MVRASALPAAGRSARGLSRLGQTSVVALILTVLAGVGAALLPSSGLRAEYFTNSNWMGRAVHAGTDSSLSTEQLLRRWAYAPPGSYSVQWFGFLYLDRPGDYVLRVSAAGAAQVDVDNELIVDSRQAGVSVAPVHFDRGSHAVLIRYSTSRQGTGLRVEWARGSERFEAIAGWRLSPRQEPYAVLVCRRAVDAATWPLVGVSVLLCGALAYRRWGPFRPSPADEEGSCAWPRVPLRPACACFVVFVVLAVVHTWPLATAPGRLSRNDNADTLLNEWAIAWVVHQAPRHPLSLFDGNVFYPERRSLAFSEPLLAQSALAAPVFASGGSPVLAYNLVLLAGFAFTGWAMCLVVRTWTGSWLAGMLSGTVVAFNAHTLTRLPHIQAQHAEFLPLALLALDAFLRWPRWSSAILVGLWLVVQGLGSIYLLVFTIVALLGTMMARPGDWLGDRFRVVAPRLAIAALVAVVLLLPVLLPYWHLRQAGFSRSLDEAAQYAAAPADYLATQSRIYARASRGSALFPGAIALVMAALALLAGKAFRDPRARACVVFGALGVVLSLGPAVVPAYDRLYQVVPLLSAIRVSARFGYLALVAVAVLAGFGLDLICRRIGSPGFSAAVGVLVVALAASEPLAAPIAYTAAAGVRSIYALPARDPRAIVVELPFPPPGAPYRNAPYMLNSTANWRPLLNGYSGFLPPSYVDHYVKLRGFPDDVSVAALQSLGVTHLFVHLDEIDEGGKARLKADARLKRIALDDPVALYVLEK